MHPVFIRQYCATQQLHSTRQLNQKHHTVVYEQPSQKLFKALVVRLTPKFD